MRVPGSLSHCCGLKLQSQEQTEMENKAIIEYLSSKQQGLEESTTPKDKPCLDGLLHYSPYHAVFSPSSRYYECLAAAEQLNEGSSLHQKPVYHSVIAHSVLLNYQNEGIHPKSFAQQSSSSNIIMEDRVVEIECNVIEHLELKFDYVWTAIRVRRVLLRRSADYIYKDEKRGFCSLNDPEYFSSCYLFLDKSWEDEDCNNGIDVIDRRTRCFGSWTFRNITSVPHIHQTIFGPSIFRLQFKQILP
jgi:hypothetical protein